MKKLFLLVAGLACLITLSIVIGCGLQKSNVTYVVNVSGLSSSLQTASFEVTADDNTTAGSYHIVPHGIAPSVTLTARNFYSTNAAFVTPQILLNRVHVDYSVVTDSNSILGTWTPTAVDTATDILIPRSAASTGGGSGEASGSGEAGSSTTVVLNNINTFAHMSEVANKILTVNQTFDGATYKYSLSLRTNFTARANVTLSGQDEYGNAVSTSFVTDIQYVK